MLSLGASALYLLVIGASLLAALTARAWSQREWHVAAWLGLAMFFAALVAVRLLTIEELLRGELRAFLMARGMLEERRSIQGTIVAVVLLGVAAAGFIGLYRAAGVVRGQRNWAVVAGLAAGGVLAMLVCLRIVSLHALDKLLFGPLKLNWAGDVGSSLAVLGAALFYVWLVRKRP
jgi:hypothetical protein